MSAFQPRPIDPVAGARLAEELGVHPVTALVLLGRGLATAESARAFLNADGTITLRGRLDDSSLTDTPAADGRPFIQSMNQNVDITLRDGNPLRINSVDETGTRSFFIQVQAERLNETGQRLSER